VGAVGGVRRPAQLCADTRMTEKHYAHLAPSYVAQTIRGTFPVARADPDILEMIAIHWTFAHSSAKCLERRRLWRFFDCRLL